MTTSQGNEEIKKQVSAINWWYKIDLGMELPRRAKMIT